MVSKCKSHYNPLFPQWRQYSCVMSSATFQLFPVFFKSSLQPPPSVWRSLSKPGSLLLLSTSPLTVRNIFNPHFATQLLHFKYHFSERVYWVLPLPRVELSLLYIPQAPLAYVYMFLLYSIVIFSLLISTVKFLKPSTIFFISFISVCIGPIIW